MKKFLSLIVVALAIVGLAQAQIVYSAGCYYNDNGKVAAVYQNDNKIWENGLPGYDYNSSSIIINPNTGDRYWTLNCSKDGAPKWGDVYCNGQVYLSNPADGGSYINSLYWEPDWYEQTPGTCLDAVGFKTGDNGTRYAAIWTGNNTTSWWHPTMGSEYPSEAYDMTTFKCNGNDADNTTYLICGIMCGSTDGSNPHAVVWRNHDVLYTLSTNNSYAYDIAYYNENVYTVGKEYFSNHWVATVWKNGNVLYRLPDASTSGIGYKIQVIGGDIYVCGSDSSKRIWKNGQVMYSYTGYEVYSFEANSSGIYAAVTGNSDVASVYKDGQVLYTINNCDYIYDICVDNVCQEIEVRTLPYFEGFETGETDWECWTVTDEGINYSSSGDASYASYWHRYGSGSERFSSGSPATGDYCVGHRYHGTADQEGWLISPPIYLQPNQDYTILSFNTFEGAPNDIRYEGVWVSTSGTNPSNFTEVWHQTDASDSWKMEEIELDAYQGQIVYIAFKYMGEDGHNWLIDDISLTEGWQPCGTVNSYPYVNGFESLGDMGCIGVIDVDQSGDQRNWKQSNTNSYNGQYCLYHPYGQSGKPQEGWAMTPAFEFRADQNYTMSFMNKTTQSGGSNPRHSVWVALDQNELAPSDFTKIWEQTSNFPSTWTQEIIDLSEYAGHNVVVAFKYEGNYTRNWCVDDLIITEASPEYTITVNSNNASWGNVTGGGTYTQGATCTVTATPNNSYEFLKWTKNNVEVSTNPSYSFTVTENATYTAVFGEHSVTYYTVSTNVNPAEAGTVDGAGTYEAGAIVYLTATANDGWYFSHWNDGITSNPRQITVTGDVTYTANFLNEEYAITVIASPEEGGAVTGGGYYNYGDVATLTAEANESYSFVSWNDGEQNSTRDITVVGNATYVALFAEVGATIYTVTVVSDNPFLGTVYGGGEYPEGSVIQISAEPNEYAYFAGWDDNNMDNPREVVVVSDMTFTAKFLAYQNYTITVESSNPTMGEVTGGGTYQEGTEIVIKAIPYEGFFFTSWDDGNAENPRTIIVDHNQTFKAIFSENVVYSYTITTMCNPNEGSVYGGGTYTQGTPVMLIALPNSGFEFDCWDDGSRDNPRNIVVTENKVYVAFFKSMGVDENETRHLVVYPNPAASVIRIAGLVVNSEVSIYNAMGMLVKNVNAGADEEIGIGELAAGVYVAHCGNAMVRFVKM